MKKLIFGISLLVALSGCSTSYVHQGNVGLLVNNLTGKVDNVLEPGYRGSIPFGQHIVEFPIIKQQYVMVQSSAEGQKSGDDSVKVNSAEGQTFFVDASVDFQIRDNNSVATLYKKYAMPFETIVDTRYRSNFKAAINNAFSGLSMSDAMTRKGTQEVEVVALKDLQNHLSADGIDVTQVMVRAVHAPEAIAQSIAAKTQAENELVKSRTVAQQQVVEAQAWASAKLIKAKAEADSNKMLANSLTPTLVKMKFIDKISDKIQLVVSDKTFLNMGGMGLQAAQKAAQ